LLMWTSFMCGRLASIHRVGFPRIVNVRL
jgi:hypothetical protein